MIVFMHLVQIMILDQPADLLQKECMAHTYVQSPLNLDS